MAEFHEPPLRLTIEGLRWLGDEWEPVGTSGRMYVYGTDHDEDAQAVLRGLRRLLAKRLALKIPVFAVGFTELDFDAPNAPTEDDIVGLLHAARDILGELEALRELSPEIVDDDDDSDDGEPDPSPNPEGSSRAA